MVVESAETVLFMHVPTSLSFVQAVKTVTPRVNKNHKNNILSQMFRCIQVRAYIKHAHSSVYLNFTHLARRSVNHDQKQIGITV